MSEDPANTTENIADVSGADRGLIVAFVVCVLLGLAALGWHYRSSEKPVPICANAEARCGDKSDPGAQ